MSGPVTTADVDPSRPTARVDPATTIITPSRQAEVGGLRVRRALPRRERRTVFIESDEGLIVEPGHLAYLGAGRDQARLRSSQGSRALLLGGIPFPEPVLMWWNFVARTQEEISEAHRDRSGRRPRAVALVVTAAVVAGLTTWLGTATQGTHVSVGTLIAAGVNVVSPALCLLGIGVLVAGIWPRATSSAVYAVLAWSLLVEVVGGIGAVSHWVLDASIFHQMAAAPAVPANWTTGGWMIAVGRTCALIGAAAFRRRDLQEE
jgi:Pirin C-terminal cupin domain